MGSPFRKSTAMLKHGVYFIADPDGLEHYYEVWVHGEFIGTEISGRAANWLFSFYNK